MTELTSRREVPAGGMGISFRVVTEVGRVELTWDRLAEACTVGKRPRSAEKGLSHPAGSPERSPRALGPEGFPLEEPQAVARDRASHRPVRLCGVGEKRPQDNLRTVGPYGVQGLPSCFWALACSSGEVHREGPALPPEPPGNLPAQVPPSRWPRCPAPHPFACSLFSEIQSAWFCLIFWRESKCLTASKGNREHLGFTFPNSPSSHFPLSPTDPSMKSSSGM